MANRILTVLLALFLATAYSARAQTHPNLEKGFAADKMYQFGDVDHVNLFNGNVALTIPVGGSLPVSDHLSLSLTMVYNSKLWFGKATTGHLGDQVVNYVFYVPERRANAGFGWTVSLGRLIDPSETDVNDNATTFLYEGPDGSDSAFYPTLHVYDPTLTGEPVVAGVFYSRDNTYLRLSQSGADRLVESPDGTIREFQPYTNGAYTRWRLIQIRDRFGNYINIDYGTAQQWRISDQYGRLTIVHFSARTSDVDSAYLNQISSIEVQTTGGGTTSYNFNYQDKWVGTGRCGTSVVVDPNTPLGYKLPLLTSIAMPDGTSYSFAYTAPIADNLAAVETLPDDPCHAGEIASTVLPTTGTISYTYQTYGLPASGCSDDPLAYTSGVATRVIHDPLTPSNDQTWQYNPDVEGIVGEQDVPCPGAQHSPAPPSQLINTVTITAGGVVAQKTRYYFSVWPVKVRSALDGTSFHDYGLPFSRRPVPFDGRYLSTEVLDGFDSTLRATYVTYEYDYGSAQFDSNRRLNGSRTVFLDDDEVAPNSLGKHYIDASQTLFDGVGHYRSSMTSGDLFGAPRSVTTSYNSTDSLVNQTALVTGTYDGSSTGGSFVLPSSVAAWVLNLYPTVTTVEGSGTSVQELCFDSSTGLLNGTRTRGSAGRAASDLVAAFGSGTSGNMAGAVISEKYYGGDLYPLAGQLTDILCNSLASPGPLGYDIRHSYTSGVRATSEYYENGATVGHKFLDRDIDSWTGLVGHSRDVSGIDTVYTYDTSRRLTTAKTGSDSQINYTYTNPTSSVGAAVAISQSSVSSGTPQVAFQYDGFGRLVLHSRSLPSDTAGVPRWTRQSTVYDAMGRKSKVYEFDEVSPPSHFTLFSSFDRFGRPSTVTKPDGSTTTLVYHGVRQIDRTSHIRTQTSADTDATTKELYDLHGRLYQVHEPNDNTIATYGYDVGGRLSTVSMAAASGTQSRAFSYDNRGFLSSETHPELGQTGYGITTYSNYDARGHALNKLTGSANGIYDLRFTYDSSERLTLVKDNGGTRELKHFLFGSVNDTSVTPTNYQQGKLTTAIRMNHLPEGDVAVTETYKYQEPSGRASERDTVVTTGVTTMQSYKQPFAYDDIGSLTTPGYPTCLITCTGSNGLAGATYQYRDGSLLSVPGFSARIGYLGNGMITSVAHDNGFQDTYRPDTNGMPRPASIHLAEQVSCPLPPAPVITATSPVAASSTGNTASVPVDGTVTYSWSINGGIITSSATGNSITYTAGNTSPLTLFVTASNACGTSAAGTATITVTLNPLNRPASLITTLGTNSSVVTLAWSSVTGATGYRMERASCLSCGWGPIGPNPINALTYNDTVAPSAPPVAYLYHVIAVASGSNDSPPSPIDYATTATVLFAETIGGNGVTPIRGSHVQELRKAIDQLRYAAGLLPYTSGWTDYNPPTGHVLASHVLDMRTALDQAFYALFLTHMSFTAPTPAAAQRIYAGQFNELRTGVK